MRESIKYCSKLKGGSKVDTHRDNQEHYHNASLKTMKDANPKKIG